jgi:hypothetical protein
LTLLIKSSCWSFQPQLTGKFAIQLSTMSSDIEERRNEVLRKIGRNVVLYQQFEVMLKLLVSHGNLSGYVCDLQEIKNKQTETVMRQTLGQVTGRFLSEAHGDFEESNKELTELKEKKMHMSFSFRIQTDEEYFNKRKEMLAKIVTERNELIHQLPLNFKLNSVEGLTEAEQYLDAQRENLLPEYENIKGHLKALDHLKIQTAEYIQSGEMERHWELLDKLHKEYVVILLGNIIEIAKRSDGWTLLTHAGQILAENASDKLNATKKQYNCRTLKDLILKTELFDIKEEPTKKGGVRVLFKLMDGVTFNSSIPNNTEDIA